jgi:hypothetical protein
MTTKQLAMMAAGLEVAAGSALIANPDFVVQLLIDASLSSGGIAVGRVGGFGLLSLGLACWPTRDVVTAQATSGLFIYYLLATLYIGYLGVVGGFVGYLLWPAFVLHGLLALLLAAPVYGAVRREWHFPKITVQIASEIVLSPKEKAGTVTKATQRNSLWLHNTGKYLAKGNYVMSQNHFTLSFPLKTPADAKALAEQLPPLMPAIFQAQDAIGTIHYSRFTVLSEKTLLFLGDFDGEFSQLMAQLAQRAGPVFDAILQHVVDPPLTPVADHADTFVEWTAEHLLHAINLYTAYPEVTAKEVKALAAAAEIVGAGELHPFLVILPMKSKLAFIEVELILRARGHGTTKDLDKVGTPHFAQFVPLEDSQVGFFTVYDGSFDKYIADFTKNIGQVFDLLFKFTKGAPPSPCRKYLQEFIDFAAGANRTPIGFYQAYPGLSVQDIHALIADSVAQPGSSAA